MRFGGRREMRGGGGERWCGFLVRILDEEHLVVVTTLERERNKKSMSTHPVRVPLF